MAYQIVCHLRKTHAPCEKALSKYSIVILLLLYTDAFFTMINRCEDGQLHSYSWRDGWTLPLTKSLNSSATDTTHKSGIALTVIHPHTNRVIFHKVIIFLFIQDS